MAVNDPCTPSQIRIITLNYGDNLESSVIRLNKGWTARFVRGASLLGRAVRVCTSKSEPIRWNDHRDEFASFAELVCDQPGTYYYQFFVDDEQSPAGSGYFLVMPDLAINGKHLPLNAISCVTYVSKLLGTLPEWKERIRVSHESGYNMIHFTPVQALGNSNSSYSITDPLSMNPQFNPAGRSLTMKDLKAVVRDLEQSFGLLSIQDVVWNHAARDAPWLRDHPECTYNLENSPHLRPAYLIDRALYHFSDEVYQGKWQHSGLSSTIDSRDKIEIIKRVLKETVLPKLRLQEFFQVDIDRCVQLFADRIKNGASSVVLDENVPSRTDGKWHRFGFTVDFDQANKVFNRQRSDASSEQDRQAKCIESFKEHLNFLNTNAIDRTNRLIDENIRCLDGQISYDFLDSNGPNRKQITADHGIFTLYFVQLLESKSLEEDEFLANCDETARFIFACNGWVQNFDCFDNFAKYPSMAYLNREIICWGDCIKLNYGTQPSDCPYLWQKMEEYTRQCAEIFHGLRIDNCHSTPIHVAEFLLKAARSVRPNLFVLAELFTNNEQSDNIFVNRLGITALIRETQTANSSHDQGGLLYRFGGEVYGSFVQKPIQDSAACVAPALIYDQTHDNESSIMKRSVYNLLPATAMIALASCGVASVRGYDELVPHRVDVVTESRPYMTWNEAKQHQTLIPARKMLNKLHIQLAHDGFTQIYVDQRTPDALTITRHNPISHEKVILIAHTSFSTEIYQRGQRTLDDIVFAGILDVVLFEMQLTADSIEITDLVSETRLEGLSGVKVTVHENLKPDESEMMSYRQSSDQATVSMNNFPPGSVIAFRVLPVKKAANAFQIMHNYLRTGHDCFVEKELRPCLRRMTLQMFNTILFRCSPEETSDYNRQPYTVPNFRQLVYCGFQGLLPFLEKIRIANDLGHPFCTHLRSGLWLRDYFVRRFDHEDVPELRNFQRIFGEMASALDDAPFDLRPCYFENMFSKIHDAIVDELLLKLHPNFAKASTFVQTLALSSVSFLGSVGSAKLSALSPKVKLEDKLPSSLAAGLPHFASSIWRNWGRDTFIALPGCLLVTGRFTDARNLILSYAGAMRHGLIPNLLAEGHAARYNARDAVWFWLYAITRFIRSAPNGHTILKMTVLRLYKNDENVFGDAMTEEELHETVHEALQRHFAGIDFVERNAGRQIDEMMSDEGFNVKVCVDRQTGFIHGGNAHNCGTWMDKMGSSMETGNFGIPATSRDGAAVEIQGLAYAVLCDLHELHEKGLYAHPGVSDDTQTFWTWNHWASKIKENFEKHFYVGDEDQSGYVNRRSIVKDVVGSVQKYADYQLRPNFAIALTVAPKLVEPSKAWSALNIAKEALLGPLGIKTLDPTDWAYNGYYDTDDRGNDKKTAGGWNYHQGPEWLWVAMYFYRAFLAVGRELGDKYHEQATRYVRSRMGAYWEHIDHSDWTSLPELTNKDGAFCRASCPAQAWTIGCLLETVNDLYNICNE